MNDRVLQVLWAAPSIEKPGAETLVAREAASPQHMRGYEGLHKPGEAFNPEPLTYRFTIEKAAEVAAKILRGDPQTLGDARATLLVAAALLALAGPRPSETRDITLPEALRAGDLG